MDSKTLIGLVRSISGQANVLTIPRIFINISGDIKSALFLSQCCYWDSKMGGKFYKTVEDWTEEIGLTRHEIDTCRKNLSGIIKTELKKANGSPTLHYYVDWEILQEKIVSFLGVSANEFAGNSQIELTNSGNSLTVDYISKEIIYEPCTEDGEPIAEKKTKRISDKKQPAELFRIAQALSEVCGISIEINKGRLFKLAKQISADPRVTPELINSTYGVGGSWWTMDWRGKLNQKPKLGDIPETIFAYQQNNNLGETKKIKGDLYSR